MHCQGKEGNANKARGINLHNYKERLAAEMQKFVAFRKVRQRVLSLLANYRHSVF